MYNLINCTPHVLGSNRANTSNSFISVVKLHHLTFCHHSNDVPLAARQFSQRRIGAVIAVPSCLIILRASAVHF